ncbi:iron ABC transporter permease [Bosea sp. 685]|uniref:ABC transporter permease n=1 Tax=Bosea sp. 685 TaxID=3080057 RepID=UPI002892A5A3|nr:iron ABC transporter permease [Bosea sp. 685]WNJ88496.1 iron ABC transporter permease [Bosea sp. 685]
MTHRPETALRKPAGLPVLLQPLTLATVLSFVALAVLIIYPLGRMFLSTLVPGGVPNMAALSSLLAQPWLLPVLGNTCLAVGVSTVFAVAIGAIFAWLNERTDANLGLFATLLPIIPLLLPSVALSIGWVFLAAPNVGLINGALARLFGTDAAQLNIYGWVGLIWVYTIHGVPYAYLVVSSAIRNLDPALEEASLISGAGLLRTLMRISLPAIGPALAGSCLLVVISGLGTYSIPAIIATTAEIDVLPTKIVHLLVKDYPPHLADAQLLGLIMLLVVMGFWLLQRRLSKAGKFVSVGGRAAGSAPLPLGRWRRPARTLMWLYILVASILPIAALLLVSVQPYWSPVIDPARFTLLHFEQVLFVNRVTFAAFRNSLMLAGTGATIAMAIAILTAIYAAFRGGVLGRIVDVVIKSPATIPNLVISLAFLTTFSGAPFFLSGTLTILLIAFIVMYIPPGSIAAASALTQVGADLREASYIAGAGEGRTIRRIVLPIALPGFAAGWTLVFVHMMGDLSASALLAGVQTPVIGFAILTIWETGSFGLLAAFSTIMCLLNAVVVGAMLWFVRSRSVR